MAQADFQRPGERSLGELVGDMTRELSELFRKEIDLAKVEAKETAQRASRAGMMFGVMAALGLQALTLICFALAWGLDAALPTGLAFLIAGVVFAGIAAFFFAKGREEMQRLQPVPEQTMQTLKEDVRWAKARMS